MADETTIRLTCQDCGTRLKVKENARGKKIRCPNKECAAVITVPPTSNVRTASQEATDSATCYFCRRHAADGPAIDVAMYGNVKYVDTVADRGRFMTYDTMTIRFPRCQGCRSLHLRWEMSHYVGCGVAFGISVAAGVAGAIFTYFFVLFPNMPDRALNAILFGGLGPFLAVFIAGTILFKVRAASFFRREGIKPYLIGPGNHDAFPEVTEKLSEGWNFGKRPPDAGESLDPQTQVIVWSIAKGIRDAPR